MTTHNEGPALLDVKAVAALFQPSPSTIWSCGDDGRERTPGVHSQENSPFFSQIREKFEFQPPPSISIFTSNERTSVQRIEAKQ